MHRDVRDAERLEGARIDVGGLATRDRDLVDLEGIDRLERLLPAMLGERGRIFRLFADVREVDVEERPIEAKVRDETPVHQRLPFDAGVELRHRQDGRVGMRVLGEGQPVERHAEAERMEVQALDVRRVPLQTLVHLGLDRPAEWLVDEERRDHDERDEGDDDQRRDAGTTAGRAKAQEASASRGRPGRGCVG